VERVNRRLHLMTNLEMETAEELQVANYGIGGHYDPHYDFARVFPPKRDGIRAADLMLSLQKEETKAFSDLGTGNRIATALFYFTQPEKGGFTVFTGLNKNNTTNNHQIIFFSIKFIRYILVK
jgi:prolyl 4-hydroxylase